MPRQTQKAAHTPDFPYAWRRCHRSLLRDLIKHAIVFRDPDLFGLCGRREDVCLNYNQLASKILHCTNFKHLLVTQAAMHKQQDQNFARQKSCQALK